MTGVGARREWKCSTAGKPLVPASPVAISAVPIRWDGSHISPSSTRGGNSPSGNGHSPLSRGDRPSGMRLNLLSVVELRGFILHASDRAGPTRRSAYEPHLQQKRTPLCQRNLCVRESIAPMYVTPSPNEGAQGPPRWFLNHWTDPGHLPRAATCCLCLLSQQPPQWIHNVPLAVSTVSWPSSDIIRSILRTCA